MKSSLISTTVIGLTTIVLFFLVSAHAGAASLGVRKISALEVKYMMANEQVLVINALSKIEHDIQHIDGSVNIPLVELEDSNKLPEDKEAILIFYCMGTK